MKREQLEQILLQKDIPITPMRQLVLSEIIKATAAITLSDLEQRLSTADRSTIYRTLKTFEKKGLIHSIQDNSTTQYLFCQDHCNEEKHHDYHLHFFCNQCKTTVCLEDVNLQPINFPSDYLVQELKLIAHGICKSCLATMQ